jgi:chromatin structure-remodeling complex protein RSC7
VQDEEIMGGGKPFRVIQGKVYVIDGDELVTEDDPKGDTKIDKNGNLLGGAFASFFFLSFLFYVRAHRVCSASETASLR